MRNGRRAVLLDTQVFLIATSERWTDLPRRVQRLLVDAEVERLLSAVSIAEVAIKSNIGKLHMSSERVNTAVNTMKLTVIPFTHFHTQHLFGLPLHHREPFDRMLIATAIAEGVPLVGGDARFPAYKAQGLSVIWK